VQPVVQGDHLAHRGHAVAAALFAGGHGNALPVGVFLVGALALEPEYAALGQQRLQAGHAEFSGLLHQPVHALVGRHADGQMDLARDFPLHRGVGTDLDLYIAAPHARDGGSELAAGAVEQRDGCTRLQPQHLHVARGAGGQLDQRAGGQKVGAVKTGHCY
jgi:hypothetical protein